jgi:hypothetical protein
MVGCRGGPLAQRRWHSEGAVGFAAGDANLYRQVGNRATNANDPGALLPAGIEMMADPFAEQ